MPKLYPLTSSLILSLLAACAPPADNANDKAAAPAQALETVVAADPADMEALKARLAKTLPGVPVDSVRATPVAGLYELQSGMNFGYVTLDGRYLIEGDLNDLASGQRLTDVRRRSARAERMDALGVDQTIEFAPDVLPAKYTITVFTDIDCGYCRKLHSEMADYNAKGIEIDYLFFPRSGLNTPSYDKAVSVWCAKDRNAAFTAAKAGSEPAPLKCDNPIASQFQLGVDLGVDGTPAVYAADGTKLGGYLPPDQLLSRLEQIEKAASGG